MQSVEGLGLAEMRVLGLLLANGEKLGFAMTTTSTVTNLEYLQNILLAENLNLCQDAVSSQEKGQ